MEIPRVIVRGVEVVSIWEDPEKHKQQIEEIIALEAKERGITVQALKKEEFKRIEKLAELIEYRMEGMNGFGAPIFLHEDTPNIFIEDLKKGYQKLKSSYNFLKEYFKR